MHAHVDGYLWFTDRELLSKQSKVHNPVEQWSLEAPPHFLKEIKQQTTFAVLLKMCFGSAKGEHIHGVFFLANADTKSDLFLIEDRLKSNTNSSC